MNIREAEESDLQAIKAAVKSAFFREGKDDIFNEWAFVDRVTKDKGFVKRLCLVAVADEEIIGYLLLSKAQIGIDTGLSLGPLAITISNLDLSQHRNIL